MYHPPPAPPHQPEAEGGDPPAADASGRRGYTLLRALALSLAVSTCCRSAAASDGTSIPPAAPPHQLAGGPNPYGTAAAAVCLLQPGGVFPTRRSICRIRRGIPRCGCWWNFQCLESYVPVQQSAYVFLKGAQLLGPRRDLEVNSDNKYV